MLLPKVIPEFGNLYSNKIEKIDPADSASEKERKAQKNAEIHKIYRDFLLFWGTLCFLSGIFTFMRKYYIGDLANRIAFRMRNKLYQNLI